MLFFVTDPASFSSQSCRLLLFQYCSPLRPYLFNALVAAEPESNLGFGEERSEEFLNTLLAANSKSIHKRASNCNRESVVNGEPSIQKMWVPKTPCAPIAIALMTSLPSRMPESNRTVNFPSFWALSTLGEAVIFSRAENVEIAPSICRPPAPENPQTSANIY